MFSWVFQQTKNEHKQPLFCATANLWAKLQHELGRGHRESLSGWEESHIHIILLGKKS